MLPNREGRFKANIIEHGVAETGPSNLATFVCKFGLIQELANGDWVPVDESLDITGYFYLEKKDGSINTITVDALKEAFGWDGRDPLWLQDTDFVSSGLLVQVKLGYELYNGRQRLKVQFVDAENAAPAGVAKADDNTRRSLSTRLGSKLRALAGGTPVSPPKPANAPRPAPVSGRPGPKVAPKSVPKELAAPSTMNDVWAQFSKAVPEHFSQEQTEAEWFRILGELLPGKNAQALTPDEWGIVRDRGIPMIEAVALDDIPF
jgi:hypothetical protein